MAQSGGGQRVEFTSAFGRAAEVLGRTAPIASDAFDPKETLDVQCNRLSGRRQENAPPQTTDQNPAENAASLGAATDFGADQAELAALSNNVARDRKFMAGYFQNLMCMSPWFLLSFPRHSGVGGSTLS
jgi:hypothetical protein